MRYMWIAIMSTVLWAIWWPMNVGACPDGTHVLIYGAGLAILVGCVFAATLGPLARLMRSSTDGAALWLGVGACLMIWGVTLGGAAWAWVEFDQRSPEAKCDNSTQVG